MKIFVAGAGGNIGTRLVPMLVARGHEVVGTTRSPAKADVLARVGAEPVVADGLDRDAMTTAVLKAEPAVVVHQMTALAGGVDPRNMDRSFATTNRLRVAGTDILLDAARATGVRRFVAQSYAGWPYARTGGPVKTEDDPLIQTPSPGIQSTLDAIKHLEAAVTSAESIEGIVLRYGGFYGPGSMTEPNSEMMATLRKRRFPVVGDGGGIWSFVHIDDAAAATAEAIERGRPGIYNIVDDDPAPVRDWLPALAAAVGAKPPRRFPAWLGRLALGPSGFAMMTEIRGASNAKAKRELGWQPAHPSWRDGFRTALG
jgi:2-alkyl-3-oxoalkanoate reductase